MTRDQFIAQNLQLARKFYLGYHDSVQLGELKNVFMPEDFADDWVFCSPFLGAEMTQSKSWELAEGAAANHQAIWQKIPDYKMDDFKAWPTERGCAWRWRVHGMGTDGNHYEFWEQLFTWTNLEGKITRFEFYDDWHGFPQTLVFAYGTSLDEFTSIEGYGAAPWTPATPLTLRTPKEPPRLEPPANPRVAQNLAIARKFFDGYHHYLERGNLNNVFSRQDFAEDWVLFSPWFGERQIPAGIDYAPVADAEHKKIVQRLADYKMDGFEAWPTEDGCAWRWCVHGHSPEGAHYQFFEQVFIDTNHAGKITRMEFYDDWKGFPQTLGYITGLSVDELWEIDNYSAWLA